MLNTKILMSGNGDTNNLTAIAAILTALAAVVIAPLATFFVTRLQIRANVISANRQAWIDKLREELAELFGLLTWLHNQSTTRLSIGSPYEQEKTTRIRLLLNKVILRLNPAERDNQTLLDLLTKLDIEAEKSNVRRSNLAEPESTARSENFDKLMDQAVAVAQTILKTEWKRVKTGK